MNTNKYFHDKTIRIDPTYGMRLKTLAYDLLRHHLEVSLRRRGELRVLLPSQTRKTLGKRPGRVVAVVGAGPSSAMVPSTESIKRELRKIPGIKEGLDAELQRLTKAYRLAPGDFETFLSACSRTHDLEQQVRRKLEGAYAVRHPAILSYEILAHLLKHRYLDAIITFNFDELLDQSIDDELSTEEHARIISERDCRGVITDPDHADYKPLYIKLHGTASDPDTLKFTREAYFSARQRIDAAVRNVLGTGDCTLLVVGSSLKSFEFNLLLEKPRSLVVYNLSTENLAPAVKQEIRSGRRQRATQFRDVIKPKPTNNAGALSGADLLLYGLTDLLAGLSPRESGGIVTFRPVHRHRLVVQVCGEPFDRRNLAEYLETRTILEVAFSGVKGRGVTSIETLAKDRSARYYDLYRESTDRPLTWREICRKGGICPHPETQDTYTIDSDVRCPGPALDHALNPAFDLGKLAQLLDHNLTGRFKHAADKNRASLIQKVLRTLDEGTEIEIRASGDIVCKKMFHAPEILQIDTALRARTTAMLARKRYNYLAVVAETGEWLLRPAFVEILRRKIREDHLQILLIVAFEQQLDELREQFNGALRTRTLPWWRHNRHLTLVCHGKRPIEGIHLTRRLRNPFVTPVHLKRKEDLHILERTFCNYWLQAEENGGRPADLPNPLEHRGGIPELP